MTIHDVGKSVRYPDGVKYALLALDTATGRRVLIDNHHPKGHHVHLDGHQFSYRYADDDRLIGDFKRLVKTHLGVDL